MPAIQENDWQTGYDDARIEVAAILTEPPTDDPLDTLAAIAEAVGVEDYDYFTRRGQWVRFPNTEG